MALASAVDKADADEAIVDGDEFCDAGASVVTGEEGNDDGKAEAEVAGPEEAA